VAEEWSLNIAAWDHRPKQEDFPALLAALGDMDNGRHGKSKMKENSIFSNFLSSN
jgi:hypothetical protein